MRERSSGGPPSPVACDGAEPSSEAHQPSLLSVPITISGVTAAGSSRLPRVTSYGPAASGS